MAGRQRCEDRQSERTAHEIRDLIRALRIQLSLLNYRVGSQLELKDVDLDCFDILDAYGPLSPSALARRAGLHPATMTGILDRLERGGGSLANATPPTAARSSSELFETATPSSCASMRA
jgi:DNA-binding MarR family transcriptional regulator